VARGWPRCPPPLLGAVAIEDREKLAEELEALRTLEAQEHTVGPGGGHSARLGLGLAWPTPGAALEPGCPHAPLGTATGAGSPRAEHLAGGVRLP
jgi:hypothetical protein